MPGAGRARGRPQVDWDLTAKSRLPSVYTIREFPDVGGLMSYGPSLIAQYRRAAVFVDKILCRRWA